jgi:hypothetical protein
MFFIRSNTRTRRPSTVMPRRGRLRANPKVVALEDRTLLSFTGPPAFNLGGAPVGVAVGQFHGNGSLDVVTANDNGTVSVLLGNGDGSFRGPATFLVGATPDAVAVGDVLGNGLPDIVTANTNGTVSVLLGNGDGTFQGPRLFQVGARLDAVAVGDVRGIGRQDIVAANVTGSVSVLLSNGDGSFQKSITLPIGVKPDAVAVGDFRGIGQLDIVTGNADGTASVLLGNGDGSFQSPVTYDLQIGAVKALAVGDLRGAGRPDVVAVDNSPIFNDFVSVLLNNGDGTFQTAGQYQVGIASQDVIVGDFHGNGHLDIVTADFERFFDGPPDLSILAGNGDGSFQFARQVSSGAFADGLAVGNFNGDGRPDLAMSSAVGLNVSVVPGNGDGSFAFTPTYAAGVIPTAVAAGDFTGSGLQDLLTADSDGHATVLLNNGDGTFRNGPVLAYAHVANGVAVADFTGSGHEDVAVLSSNFDAQVSVYLGNGDGTFQDPRVVDLGDGTIGEALVVGDFNGDGKPDLAVAFQLHAADSFVETLLGNGDGSFQVMPPSKIADDARGLAVGDFTSRGPRDLVSTSNTGAVSVLLGNGDGTFQNPVTLAVNQDNRAVAVGDFTGHGLRDLAVPDIRGDVVSVLLGNGDGTFQSPVNYPVGHGPNAVVVGDFTGNGTLDLAVANDFSNTVSVLPGNGDGTFGAAVDYLVGATDGNPRSLVAGAFTGGPGLDLAVTNFLDSDVSVLLNRNDGTAAPKAVGRVQSATAAVDILFAGAGREWGSGALVGRQSLAAGVDLVSATGVSEVVSPPRGQPAVLAYGPLSRRIAQEQGETGDAVVLADPLAEAL